MAYSMPSTPPSGEGDPTMDATITIGTAKDGATARYVLTEQEAEECARLSCGAGRRDFRAGRLAVKRALERRDSDAVVSACSRDGRAVAVAAPAGVRVGVDFERAGSLDLPSVRAHLTAFEEGLAANLDPAVVWSAKRAAWKALGMGVSLPIGEIELCPGPSGKLVGVYVGDAFLPMHTRITEPWPGYAMTTVWMPSGLA